MDRMGRRDHDRRRIARRLGSKAERGLTIETARGVVTSAAADELPLFDRTSRAFFRRAGWRTGPDIAGSGLDLVWSSVTEAALVASGSAVLVMLSMVAEKLGERLVPGALKRLPWARRRAQRQAAVAALATTAWSPEEVARIHAAALTSARSLGAGQEMAEVLADLIIGRLVVSSLTTPAAEEPRDDGA